MRVSHRASNKAELKRGRLNATAKALTCYTISGFVYNHCQLRKSRSTAHEKVDNILSANKMKCSTFLWDIYQLPQSAPTKTTAGGFIPRTQATSNDRSNVDRKGLTCTGLSRWTSLGPRWPRDKRWRGKQQSGETVDRCFMEMNLSHTADWVSSFSVAKRSPAFQRRCVGGCTPGAISDRYWWGDRE